MYLSAGRYKDVSRVRKMMRDEKLGKLKDRSWISIKDKVHLFKPDGRLHPDSAEMQKLLGELLDKAKSLGYESQGSLEVTDEEVEEKTFTSTVYHSEKLAVVFGLLNMPNAAPIRLLKSIRSDFTNLSMDTAHVGILALFFDIAEYSSLRHWTRVVSCAELFGRDRDEAKKMVRELFVDAEREQKRHATLTKSYTGAELEGVVRRAVSFAVSNQVVSLDGKIGVNERNIKVTMDDFLKAVQEITPMYGTSTFCTPG
ncbi:hypothetical protein L1049_026855 [Liquidambar formosana]|uniref:Vesicle-fusing ATPase n=1 Tax=Liquidambar formosana TaxID=63359 RepID=A0AAP0NG98_LIQFO